MAPRKGKRTKPKRTKAQKPWTVLVYMAAQDDERLDNLAVKDLREMERGSLINDNVTVIVQIKRAWPGVPQRYRISKGKTELLEAPHQTDMGSGETLTEFLTWVDETYPQFRANPYLLVLWGHAFGLGFGRDHSDPLTLPELKKALKAFAEQRGKHLEMLGTNACAMSYAEAAFELRDCVDYLVASEIAVPFAGWPYETIVKGMKSGMSELALGTLIIDSYVNHFAVGPSDLQVSMSLLNLRKAPQLEPKLKALTTALHEAMIPRVASGNNGITLIRDVFRATAGGDVRPLIDLSDLCEGVQDLFAELDAQKEAQEPYKGPNDAAKALKDFLLPAIEQIGQVRTPSKGKPGALFVEYHRRHPELQELRGVGIFAPFVTDEQDLKRLELADQGQGIQKANGQTLARGETAYRSLQLVNEKTGWGALVYDDLHQEIADDIWNDVDGCGATNRVDRSAVTQMLVSVDSTFNTFDRTLANVREDINRRLTESLLTPADGVAAAATPGNRIKEIRKFGAQSLRLFDSSDLETQIAVDMQVFRDVLPKAAALAADTSSLSAGTIPQVVGSCRRMEKALSELERATKRILTHAEFGLGPPAASGGFGPKPSGGFGPKPSGGFGPKPSGGFGPKPSGGFGPKPSGGFGPKPSGGFGPKPSGGFGPKPSGGFGNVEDLLENALGALVVPADQTPAGEVAQLFSQVASILSGLEQAAANVERTAAIVLTDPRYGFGLSPEDVKDAATNVIGQAFSELEELASLARRTVRRVLANPVYGLGPGSQDLGRVDREEFAKFGGLSRLNLRLL